MTNTQPLLIMKAADAALCEGEFCEIPERHEQAMVNSAIDADRA